MTEERTGTVRSQALGMAGFTVAFAIAVMVIFAGMYTDWFGLATPRFQPGVQYEFSYSYETTAVIGDQFNVVTTRHFVVDQSTLFAALASGPRGERAIVEDTSLPPNTFVFKEVIVPEVTVGGRVFQDEYAYIETRYYIARKEPQVTKPEVPERRRR